MCTYTVLLKNILYYSSKVNYWYMERYKNKSLFFPLQCQINPDSGEPQDELSSEAVEFCKKLGSNATSVSDISGGRDRAINAAIQEGINRVNEKATSNAQRIQKWIVLDRDFSIGGGELGE